SEHSLWLPRFWDSLNFKKDMEFVGITVLFLDEKVYYHIASGFILCFDIITDISTHRCGWANPFCPGLWPHQRNNLSCYPSPH
ncbi:hypothetical protein HID58_088235, partial [Brassica napus]